MDSQPASTTTGSEHFVRQYNIQCQNIGRVFNNDLYSDLVLIVGEERFKVHKVILTAQSEYFQSLLTNGWSESSKREIEINDEDNVSCFGKLLQYVYSGEVKFDGTNDAIEMMIMANKYLFTDLQTSIGAHLAAVLTVENFCPIYSAAFSCSASDLVAKCLGLADAKSSEILKLDGFGALGLHAINEIIRRDTFKPIQAELFVTISSWIAANKDEDASLLLSHVRLEEMQLEFLLKTVRSSKLFSESRILDAATAISEKMANTGKSLTSVYLTTYRQDGSCYGAVYDGYSFDTIGRVKDQVRVHYTRTYDSIWMGSIRLQFQGGQLQDDRTLESYGILNGTHLHAYCE